MTYQYPLSDFFRGPHGSGGKGGGGGSGGKKGGGGSDDNTLRSKARARMLEAISEGPCLGLVDENMNVLTGEDRKKAIFFDQTPIMNADGTINFKNVLIQEHKGYADEGHFQGQDAVETPHSVEVQVKKNIGPTQRTIVDENADAVRVIVRLPALARNDTENGGLKRTSVAYAFEVRSYNGTWNRVVENYVNDQKTTSPFQIAHKIRLPLNGSPWDVRMVRLTDDSEDTELQNETWWEGYIVLVEGKFVYPNTGMVGLEVNAEDMGSSIPPRSHRWGGLIVQVPSNYDAFTRTYTGIWDGTFKWSWTNNPAWVFYDLLINDRYGLGEFVNPAIVDKWSLYTIAQYCDQSVRSGYKNGDTGQDIWEPRFTFNGVLNSRDEAFFVLQQISTAWRGMAYWSLGQVFATADMPQDPVKLVSPANVLGGEFSYSSTAIKARHSVVVVNWNDPNDFYRPAKEIVINQAMLNKYGWRQKDLQLTGCTSRGLAHRYGKWVLDTEQNETETIEYQASWDHVEVKPGDIVAVADPRKAQVRLAGRIAGTRTNSLAADLDFVSGSYALDGVVKNLGQLNFTRAIAAYVQRSDGTWWMSGPNAPLLSDLGLYLEPESINHVRNTNRTGAQAGEPGVVPSGWVVDPNLNGGVTRVGVELTEIDGIPVVGFRYTGLCSASGSSNRIKFQTVSSTPAVPGEALSMAAFVAIKVEPGTATPGSTQLRIEPYENTTTRIETRTASINADGTLRRVQLLNQTMPATTLFANLGISLGVTSGQNYDFTVYVGLPQMHRGATVPNPISGYIGSGPLTRPADLLAVPLATIPAVPAPVTGWTLTVGGTGSAVETTPGNIALSADGTESKAEKTLPITIGRRYRLRFTVGGANIGVRAGIAPSGVSYIPNASITPGAKVYEFLATSSTLGIRFYKTTAGTSGSASNITLEEVPTYSAKIAYSDGTTQIVGDIVPAAGVWQVPVAVPAKNVTRIEIEAPFSTAAEHVTVVELDYDIEPVEGQDYELIATMPDGSLEKKAISVFLDARTVLLAEPLSQKPLADAMFAITGDVVPRNFRVLSVDETEPNIFKVSGLFHDPNKFARVEQDVVFDPLPYKRDTSAVVPPTNLAVRETGYVSNGQGFHSLLLSWTPPADFLNRGFLVSVVVPDGTTQILGTTMNPWFEMQNTGVGTYKFMVQTIGFTGVPSNAAEFTFEASGPNGFAMPIVDLLRLKDNPAGNDFSGVDLSIEWDNKFATSTDPIVAGGAPQHVVSPHYTFNTVKVFNNSTGALLRSARVTGESFVYDLATNAYDSAAAALAGPSRSLRVEVTVHDVFGRTSAVASEIFTNPAPAVVTPSFTPAGATIVMAYPLIADGDFRGVKVWRSTTPGVNVSGAPFYEGMANPLTIQALPNSTYYFRVGAYDAFSQADMVISGEFTVTTGFDVYDDEAPATPSGLVLSTRVETINGIATRMILKAEVNLNSEEDFAAYDFEIKEGTANWLSFSSAVNVYEWPIMPTQTYQVRVRALDRTFNSSVRTDVETITAPTHPGLAAQINAGSTTIDPGKILISGATTLADWRRGGDTTKIDGGALSANTVSANKMTIGQRGVNLEGVEFEHNKPATNQVSWTAGQISYVDDTGTAAVVSVTAGSASWTGPALYVFWAKDTTSLQATSVFATAMHANNIILAVYRGGRDLNANYGRTVIDGAIIKTGTVQATALVAQNLSAISADLGDITAGRARSSDSKMVIDFNSKFISIEV